MPSKGKVIFYTDPSELDKLFNGDYHKLVKDYIKKDLSKDVWKKLIPHTNPDIGIDKAGNIYVRAPKSNQEIETGLKVEYYIIED